MPARNSKTSAGGAGKKNAAATESEQQARADEESARKLLDAATGATGKSSPTYHGSNRKQNKEEEEDNEPIFESRCDEHAAWKKAVDQYVANADDVATLTAQDMRDAVRESVSEEVLVTHASAIEDYFEQSCARRRSGLAADQMNESENVSGKPSANTPSKTSRSTSGSQQSGRGRAGQQKGSQEEDRQDRAERLRSGADGSLNKSSPTYHKSRKTEEGEDEDEDKDTKEGRGGISKEEQDRRDRAERLRSGADGSLNKSSPTYHQSKKGESEGVSQAEQDRRDRAERLRSGADGSLNKSSPTYHQSKQGQKQGQGAEERKDWHDAVDKYLDDNEGGETSLDAMRSAVRDAIGGDELISNAGAIEEYFQVSATRRREERLGRTEGGEADASEGAQKRSRSGDADQTSAMASAPKAARTG